MKRIYFITLLLISVFTQAQIVNIPDANFKNALVNDNVVDTTGDGIGNINADTNNDGEIQVSESESILRLNVSLKNITSLEGIHSFVNLEFLELFANDLTILDVSQNLNLVELGCQGNQLTNLDFSQNLNLESLWCSSNQLTNINLSQNLNLRAVNCGLNLLTNLDITNNLNLEFLQCPSNLLTSLDVTQNPNLNSLSSGNNSISNLDVTQNQNLRVLSIWETQIVSIDLSQNPNLIFLDFRGNQFTSIDLSQNLNLEVLLCYDNILTSLDLSHNTNLERLSSYNNQLSSLNIKNGNNINMTKMLAYNNPNLTCIQVDDENASYPNCTGQDGWCKDETAQYSEECILGTEDNAIISFSLYPNPTQKVLFINTPGQIETVKIFSLQGQLINENSNTSIDVSTLTTGLYFAQITIDGKTSSKKFVKL